MEAKAQARFVRVTPQKARRVVDVIRGRRALEAVDVLRYAPQGAAETVRKIVDSAIALFIQAAYVDEGPTMKRIQPRAQGRANRILKRTSHITVIVGDDVAAVKNKAKKRRTR